MTLSEFLAHEWKPALGCTEPASIAYAAARAAARVDGPVRALHLRCDPRMFKNCYAVGIPHSGHKVGIRWAMAIGALLPDASAGLEVFKQATPEIVEEAGRILDAGAVTVEVDPSRSELLVDCQVVRAGGVARAVIEREHTRLVRLEKNGQPLEVAEPSSPAGAPRSSIREQVAGSTSTSCWPSRARPLVPTAKISAGAPS